MTDLVWTLDDGDAAGRWQAPSGGGSQTVRREKFDFAFDTAGLSDGVAAFTLADGEEILDVSFIISEAWDGTTPLGDIGFGTDASGIFASLGHGSPQGVDMTNAARSGDFTGGLAVWAWQTVSIMNAAVNGGNSSPGWGSSVPIIAVGPVTLNVWVTELANRGGTDPGATQGACQLRITIGSPA